MNENKNLPNNFNVKFIDSNFRGKNMSQKLTHANLVLKKSTYWEAQSALFACFTTPVSFCLGLFGKFGKFKKCQIYK